MSLLYIKNSQRESSFWRNVKEFQSPKYIKKNRDPIFLDFVSFLKICVNIDLISLLVLLYFTVYRYLIVF